VAALEDFRDILLVLLLLQRASSSIAVSCQIVSEESQWRHGRSRPLTLAELLYTTRTRHLYEYAIFHLRQDPRSAIGDGPSHSVGCGDQKEQAHELIEPMELMNGFRIMNGYRIENGAEAGKQHFRGNKGIYGSSWLYLTGKNPHSIVDC